LPLVLIFCAVIPPLPPSLLIILQILLCGYFKNGLAITSAARVWPQRFGWRFLGS
jgi:hypothetical protein